MTCDKKTEYTFTLSEEEARTLFGLVATVRTPELNLPQKQLVHDLYVLLDKRLERK
jgi:hypothetical protein